MAAKHTYDLANKLIIINSGVTEIDVVVDFYSDWKEDVLADPQLAGMDEIFRAVAGDPIPGGRNLSGHIFLRNDLGWRIRPPEENTEIDIIGNLWPEDELLPMTVPTLGGFTVLLRATLSANSFDLAGTGRVR